MIYTEIEYQSELYTKSLELRYKILRKPLGLRFTKEFLSDEMNNFHLAAIEDNEIRAVVLLKPMEDNIVKMRQFAVDSKYQHQGIGQKLTKLAEQFAGEKNYKKIVLHARKSAVGFYLNMNYTLISKEFLEVGLPHYEMEKILEK